jgi:hypothetical protein
MDCCECEDPGKYFCKDCSTNICYCKVHRNKHFKEKDHFIIPFFDICSLSEKSDGLTVEDIKRFAYKFVESVTEHTRKEHENLLKILKSFPDTFHAFESELFSENHIKQIQQNITEFFKDAIKELKHEINNCISDYKNGPIYVLPKYDPPRLNEDVPPKPPNVQPKILPIPAKPPGVPGPGNPVKPPGAVLPPPGVPVTIVSVKPPGVQGIPPGVSVKPPGVQGIPPGVSVKPPGVQVKPPGIPGIGVPGTGLPGTGLPGTGLPLKPPGVVPLPPEFLEKPPGIAAKYQVPQPIIKNPDGPQAPPPLIHPPSPSGVPPGLIKPPIINNPPSGSVKPPGFPNNQLAPKGPPKLLASGPPNLPTGFHPPPKPAGPPIVPPSLISAPSFKPPTPLEGVPLNAPPLLKTSPESTGQIYNLPQQPNNP